MVFGHITSKKGFDNNNFQAGPFFGIIRALDFTDFRKTEKNHTNQKVSGGGNFGCVKQPMKYPGAQATKLRLKL